MEPRPLLWELDLEPGYNWGNARADILLIEAREISRRRVVRAICGILIVFCVVDEPAVAVGRDTSKKDKTGGTWWWLRGINVKLPSWL